MTSGSCQENDASMILHDITRARENVQESLAGSSGPGSSSGPAGDHSKLIVQIASLEEENKKCRGLAQDLQDVISKSEAHLSTLEKISSTQQTTAPTCVSYALSGLPNQEDSHINKGRWDNDIDLFGSDEEEEDKKAALLQEERLQQFAEKEAKKPSLVARSSILLDVKPWGYETDKAQLETCGHFPPNWIGWSGGVQADACWLWNLEAADPLWSGRWQSGHRLPRRGDR